VAAWVTAVAGMVLALALRLFRRVQVEGDSMLPTLLPGDRLLVLRITRARPGALVVVADPRRPERLVVKRVARADPEGLTVLGDNEQASTDSRAFGPVRRVEGVPVYRYRPSERAGRLRYRAAEGREVPSRCGPGSP
jgi:nickel-type superoxide dismutase maturation protease